MPVEFNFNHLSGAVGTKCLPGSILSKIVLFHLKKPRPLWAMPVFVSINRMMNIDQSSLRPYKLNNELRSEYMADE